MKIRKNYHLICLSLSLLLAGCASTNNERNSFSYFDEMRFAVVKCAESIRMQFQEITPDFLVFDLPDMDYLVIVSEQDAANNAASPKYCHVLRDEQQLLYTSGVQPLLNDEKQSREFINQYENAYSGRVSVNKAKVSQFKLVNGIWRYIDSRDISRF